MDAPVYDLVRANYTISNPLAGARFQRTALDFMEAVRANAFQGPGGRQIMDDFCAFVSSERVWRLAQNVVPEFRSAPAPSAEEDAAEGCLNYVYRRSKLPLLPAPRSDVNVLTSEEKMLRDRHRTYVEYLETGGKGKDGAPQEVLENADALCDRFYKARGVLTRGDDVGER